MEKSSVLLVPSATLVPEELRLDLGPIPMGMIPLQGKPSIEHISGKYDSDVSRKVATMESRELIGDYISRKDNSWTEITLDDSSSLAETILKSLERIDIEDSMVYINFADTLIEPVLEIDEDLIYYDEVDHRSRWTGFSTKDGKITKVTEKFKEHPNGSQKVFSGLFGISDPLKFRESLKESLESDEDLSPFFEALMNYLENQEYRLVKSDTWIDVGHLDTYHEAKKKFLNTRKFNELDVDSKKNVITKRSSDTEKLRPEIEWYEKMPQDLKPYTPRIYSSSFNASGSMIKMDYTGYPSLGELLLFGSHEGHIWNTIYSNIFQMLDEFESYTKELESGRARENLEEMYLEKTKRRMKKVKNSGGFEEFFEKDEIEIKGERYKSADYIYRNLERILEKRDIYSQSRFFALHGDLNFSNILYDVRSGSIKLIDPRGEFGEFAVYGDMRYDLAKMRHSVSGKYDFVINDMFSIEVDKKVEYEIFETNLHREREEKFNQILKMEYGKEIYRDVKTIESLLFLSMVPLHSDYPERQRYMLSRGIELFNESGEV